MGREGAGPSFSRSDLKKNTYRANGTAMFFHRRRKKGESAHVANLWKHGEKERAKMEHLQRLKRKVVYKPTRENSGDLSIAVKKGRAPVAEEISGGGKKLNPEWRNSD